MVIENLMTERQQIVAYTTLMRDIGDQDLTTYRILGDILEETEQHAAELADYLKLRSEMR
jgi:bacterioferritin (cytochrome b1)